MKKKLLAGLATGVFILVMAEISLASVISDFSWVSLTPVSTDSTSLTPSLDLTLTSSGINFFRFDTTKADFFDLVGSHSPTITLEFSNPISNLRLLIEDLDGSPIVETLSSFNIVPTSTDGDYSLVGGVVNSSIQNGIGNLYWSTLPTNTTSISFQYNRLDGCGSFLNELEITAVPLPASLWLLGSGLIGFVGMRKRTKLSDVKA